MSLSDQCADDNENFMDKVRLVILGEASTLSTFFLKNNQRLTKSNYIQLSKLASLIIEDEDEAESNEEYLVVDPLIKKLILLKSRLSKDRIISLDSSYIKPFCDVIVNKDVSGPVTGLALQSILKFLNYGFIKDGDIICLIGESVTKARFVGTDSSSDEAVLMRILSVLENLIVHPFYSLSNGTICEIMQSCFRIAFETRLSELLRKCAVKSLTEMVRALFSRISLVDQDAPDFNYCYQDKNNASYHKLNRMGRRFANQQSNTGNKSVKVNQEDVSNTEINRKSYGLACIHELLSYLTSLINPLPDGQNSEYMISVGLNLLIIIFETSANEIGSKYCLLSVVKTDLSWNIMQLLQNDKNLNSFTRVLRLAFIIYVNLRMHLKYQFELFLLRLMDIVTTMNAPLEFRDICVEYLLLFFRHISYLPHELFYNYDCDPYSSNILEDLLQLFSKNCFANSNQNNNSNPATLNFTTLQMLSFEALLSNLKSLHKVELCKEHFLTANPATMIVNVSNIREISYDKSKEESEYNICSSVKELEAIQDNSSSVTDSKGDTVSSNSDQLNQNSPILNELENFEVLNKPSSESLNQQELEVTGPTINKYCVTYLFPDSTLLVQTTDQISALKVRKSLLWTATEKFNQKPSKGVEYLLENKLINNDDDLVAFLRNNPKLDKKQIGDYLSNKKNMGILSKFVDSFAFKGARIDEALRLYLESFRLPGEAPLISLILEQFAHHWHESNNCPFANEDAAFSLSYAIIMLNVDQHNLNVKRQTNPMTCDEFISNLRQVNGGKDFDRNLLSEIYYVIKNNEIIMPAEQVGVVREKYLWKCLLKNSETLNGIYWFNNLKLEMENVETYLENCKNSKEGAIFLNILNRSIFDILWSPSISTLILVFDKLNPDKQPTLSRRVLNNGFANYSLLCSNYGHLDNLIVNLSKFVISSTRITNKSKLVAHFLFGITKEYANEMRTSWSNIIQLILFWYDNKLLDDGFEIEDFAMDSKKLTFSRKSSLKNLKQINENANQSTFLYSFYSYFASNPQNEENGFKDDLSVTDKFPNQVDNGKSSNPAETSQNEYCHALVLIIEESKFLHIDSLIELIKALINVQLTDDFDDDIEVFKLEILVKIILMNRDRLSIFWEHVYKYIIRLMKFCHQSEYLSERIISAVFRLAIRFTPRPDSLNDQIFFLIYQMLQVFEPPMLQRNITALALHSFVSHCNCFFSKNEEWALIFSLILSIAIGYFPSRKKQTYELSDTVSRGYTSDSELTPSHTSKHPSVTQIHSSASYTELSQISSNYDTKKIFFENGFTVNYPYKILDIEAYEKCADILSLIIREYLPNNSKTSQNKADLVLNVSGYEISQMAVGVLSKFVEASIKIQFNLPRSPKDNILGNKNYSDKSSNMSRLSRFTNAILSSSEDESDDDAMIEKQPTLIQPKLSSVTESCALKLLDLMHYFHLNAMVCVGDSISPDALWNSIWCPLLQAISFFCCDCRRPVRTYAFTFLHRTLLLHDLNALNATQWESCFNKVLFPLLSKLLEPINMCDPIGMDETRMRTTNLLCKVFLQHLNPLLSLNTFTALWLTILDFMDKYIKANMQTDLVKEAIPESLKNILLVMKTAGCFNDTLAAITWDRINVFLPNLYQELFVPRSDFNETTVSDDSIVDKVMENPTVDIIQSRPDDLVTASFDAQCQIEHSINSCENNLLNPHDTISELSSAKIIAQSNLIDESKVNPESVSQSVYSHQQHFENNSEPKEATQSNQQKPIVQLSQNYNLKSTFIDMESICPYVPETNIAPKTTGSFNHFPTNAYPGSIAQFHPETNLPTSSYFQSSVDRNPILADCTNKSTSTTSTYPWPLPNLNDGTAFNK